MPSHATKVLMGFYFYPRGGSAHAARAIANELECTNFDVTILAGSRSDLGDDALADHFFPRGDLSIVDFVPALESLEVSSEFDDDEDAPMHGSYEDRPDAPDPVFATLDDEAFEVHVEAWTRELAGAGAGANDVLYLHHLTPINEAALRGFPDVPVVGHVHGSELLMLERICRGAPSHWEQAEEWAERIFRWAAGCERIVVNSPEGRDRAADLLDLDPSRFVLVPNGFDPSFEPLDVDRRAHWRRHLVESPRGWSPDSEPGSVRYVEEDLAVLDGPTLLYSGRFTEVKRLTLLIEAFAHARDSLSTPAALVLLGGYPGEWEGEHPIETVERLGVGGVFLAGWHGHDELPRFLSAADVLVHASVREQFGQVLVEAMACGLPVIAVDRGGPATIVDDGESGWLVAPDDRDAMSAAMAEAVNDADLRRKRGRRALEVAGERYTWEQIGERLGAMIDEVLSGADGSRRELEAELPGSTVV